MAMAYGVMAGLVWAPIRAAALERDDGLILQGLDGFARDHISHLCSRLIRQGSLQPVYLVYSEPRLPKAAGELFPSSVEPGAIDRSNETAKQLADRYAAVLSEDANRISSAHFRVCHAPSVMASPPPSVSVVLVSRTETQQFGVFYHRLGDVPDTDVIALSTDMSLAASALARAWNIELTDDTVERSSSWHQWLRGAVPGGLIALGSSVPFLLAESRVNRLSADCAGSGREQCDFDSRADGIETLDAWHQGMLFGGLGLGVVGGVLCGALDVCLWPESLWFGATTSEVAAKKSTLRMSVDLRAISVQGKF